MFCGKEFDPEVDGKVYDVAIRNEFDFASYERDIPLKDTCASCAIKISRRIYRRVSSLNV